MSSWAFSILKKQLLVNLSCTRFGLEGKLEDLKNWQISDLQKLILAAFRNLLGLKWKFNKR